MGNRQHCRSCQEYFVPKRAGTLTCSRVCRDEYRKKRATRAAARLAKQPLCTGYPLHKCTKHVSRDSKGDKCKTCKRIAGRYKKFFSTKFGRRLRNEILDSGRAPSLMYFPDIEGLDHWADLQEEQARKNTIVDGKSQRNFSIAHRVAVSHPFKYGYYSKDNLIRVPTLINQKNGNKDIFNGRVDKHFAWKVGGKNCKWSIPSTATPSLVKSMFEAKFGIDFIHWVDRRNFALPSKTVNEEFSKQGSTDAEYAVDSSTEIISEWILGGHQRDSLSDCQHNEAGDLLDSLGYRTGATLSKSLQDDLQGISARATTYFKSELDDSITLPREATDLVLFNTIRNSVWQPTTPVISSLTLIM